MKNTLVLYLTFCNLQIYGIFLPYFPNLLMIEFLYLYLDSIVEKMQMPH